VIPCQDFSKERPHRGAIVPSTQLRITLLSLCNFERHRNPTSATAGKAERSRDSLRSATGPGPALLTFLTTCLTFHHHRDGLGKVEGDDALRGYRNVFVAGKRGARSAGAGSQQTADQGTLAAAGEAPN
jgi:hypothetical protein